MRGLTCHGEKKPNKDRIRIGLPTVPSQLCGCAPAKEPPMNKETGTLYGLGVGPGDPELITLKAARVLNSADVVYAAASSKNTYSLAVSIARPHIPELTPIRMMHFPMTKNPDNRERAWQKNARILVEELQQHKTVAFITLGDSMTYSTYGYILKHVQQLDPNVTVVSVPGITSYQASAACLNDPLVEDEEALLIVSGVNGGECLRKFAVAPDNLVFMKAYRNMPDITAALDEFDLVESSVAVQNCGLPDQEIIKDIRQLEKSPPNYWTLILSRRRKRNGTQRS
jgi:precorrin-2/cobalt-factor-2 C20-methyltransferase